MWLLAVASILSGCAATAEPDDAPTVAPAAAPVAPAPGSAEGAVPPAGSAPEERRAETQEARIEMDAAVGAPCPDGRLECTAGVIADAATFRMDPEDVAKITLTATWDATTPLGETLRIVLHAGEEGFAAEGPSPLSLDVPPEALPADGDLRVRAVPTTPGATAREVVELTLVVERQA